MVLILDTPRTLTSLSALTRLSKAEIDAELADLFGKGIDVGVTALNGECLYWIDKEDGDGVRKQA